MNGPVPEIRRGASPRWLVNVLIFFLGQLYLILLLSQYPSPPTQTGASFTRIHALPITEPSGAFLNGESLSDPTLFALPNENGFSGTAWLKPSPFPYRPAKDVAPPEWRLPDLQALGTTQLASRSDEIELPIQEPASVDPPPPAIVGTPDLRRTRWTWRIEGNLAERQFLGSVELPPVELKAIVTNTAVRLVVGPGGETLSALLWEPSGSPVADQAALKFAKAARFSPAVSFNVREGGEREESAPEVSTGLMIFQWVPVSTPETNRLSLNADAPPGQP